jgi:hypothetical protein
MEDQNTSKTRGGAHFGGNARVNAEQIAGNDINVHYYAKANDPFASDIELLVDRFLHDISGYSNVFFRDPEGTDHPIEFLEDVERRPYLSTAPVIMEERLILRVDSSPLKAGVLTKCRQFNRRLPSEERWHDISGYFSHEQVVLLKNVALTGQALARSTKLGGAGVGYAGVLGTAMTGALFSAPATLGLSLLAIPVGIVAANKLKQKLQSDAHYQNHDVVSAFRKESIAIIQSCRSQVVTAILAAVSRD